MCAAVKAVKHAASYTTNVEFTGRRRIKGTRNFFASFFELP
jgi:hypothetical protein